MTDTTKPQPDIIVVTRARLAFARLHNAEQKKKADGTPYGAKLFSCTLLLDPSNKDHQATILAVKKAAEKAVVAKWGPRAEGGWPKDNAQTGTKGLILCFGNGNDLPKVYDGYKDMFFIKCADTTRPLLGNRRGEPVVEGDPQCPYAGCYVRARISPWVYFPTPKRPQSANGVNMNIRSVQFMEDGAAFGGGGSRTAEEEFEAYEDAPAGSEKIDSDIPF